MEFFNEIEHVLRCFWSSGGIFRRHLPEIEADPTSMTYGTAIFSITENGDDNVRNGIATDRFPIGSCRNCQSRVSNKNGLKFLTDIDIFPNYLGKVYIYVYFP